MKLRVILTLLVVLGYWIAASIYNLLSSPMIGTANAQQLTDTPSGYTESQLAAWFGGSSFPFYSAILLICIIWLSYFKKEDRGTSKKSEGIPVNTKDNIGLTIGLTITTCVEEDDASTYLYYHGETPLAVVTDQNIRSFAVAELNRVVSSLTLVEFQQQQANIYTTLFKDTAEYYKTKGVTVQYLGNAEGWRFSHKEIQDGINKSFLAQQDNKTAEMEQQATKTRNQTKIMNQENDNKIKVMAAQAEVDAAKKLQEAKDAAEFQNQLKIALITAQARATMADKWNGSLPANILPSNSPLLLSLGENNVSTNHVR